MPAASAKFLGTIGDPSLELDGGRIYEYSPGHVDLEWVEAPPERMDLDDSQARWYVYTISLDQEIPDWGDLQEVANTTSQPMMRVANAFLSANPIDRAWAYELWAHTYGWNKFDDQPRELKKREIERRYNLQLGTLPKPLPLSGVTPMPFQRKQHSVIITDDTNDEEYELKTGHGTKDHVSVYKAADDAYYVLTYSTRGIDYIGLAFFGRVRDLDQGKPHEPGGEIFLQNDDEIEKMFPDGFRNASDDEMIEQLQQYI